MSLVNMKYCVLLINFLIGFSLTNKVPSSNKAGTILLSLIRPFWHVRRHTSIALNPPKCTVNKNYPYNKSVQVSTYGITRNYSVVLTGYGLDDDRSKPRSNKGFLYGWNSIVKPSIKGKTTFIFYSDFEMPKPVRGQSAEFCCHIYSPPLKIGPSVKSALGTSVDDPSRNFGSDERMDQILRKESNNGSKKISSCCFLVHG